MKTQRLNLLEAMNFALAGHEVKDYMFGTVIKLKGKQLAYYEADHMRGIKLDAAFIQSYKDEEWHAGDDRTIKGYYEEE